jgi:putative membrane protein
MRQLDPATRTAITEAVQALERCSCAEVVVEVRGRSGSYAQAEARFASLLAFVTLLVLLFSPWTFNAIWVALDVAIAWFLGSFAARRSDALRRLMTSRRERETQVRIAAASAFHERGIANTSAETGVLVYLSMVERRIELLADRGVLESVPALEWNRLAAEARARHATPETLVEIVRALTPLLERHLPVAEGDVDELGNVPQFVIE